MTERTLGREQAIYRVTWIGFAVNLVLSAGKLAAGIWGHSAAMVADAIHSVSDFATDLVVLLSDIEGLYTADPHTHADAKLIPVVEEITPEIEALAGGAGSRLGTGGMQTKISAAKRATAAGADMIITNGARADVLYDIVEGKPVGTRFIGKKEHAQ